MSIIKRDLLADADGLHPRLCEEPLRSAKEIAAILSVSVDTVYRYLPCIRIAGTYRYSELEVKRFLAQNTLPCARHGTSRFVRRKR